MLDVARIPVSSLAVEGMRWMPRIDRFEARRFGMLADGRRLAQPPGAVDGALRTTTLRALWSGLTTDVDVAGIHLPGMDFEDLERLCDRALSTGCSWSASLVLDDVQGAWTWEATLVDEVAYGRMPAMRGPTLASALLSCVAEAEADPMRLAVDRAGHQVPDWLGHEVERRRERRPLASVIKHDPRRDDIRRRTIALRENMPPDFMRAFSVGTCTGPRDATPLGGDDGSAFVRITLNGTALRAGPDSARRLAHDILAALGEAPGTGAVQGAGDDAELARLRVLAGKAAKGHLKVSPTHWGFIGLDSAVDPVEWDGGTMVNGTPHLRILGDGERGGLRIDDARFVAGCWNFVVRLLAR